MGFEQGCFRSETLSHILYNLYIVCDIEYMGIWYVAHGIWAMGVSNNQGLQNRPQIAWLL